MPDCFQVLQEIVKSYSLPIGQRLRQAQQDLTKAKEAPARRQGRLQAAQDASEAKALVEARQAEVQRWEEVQGT